MFHSWSCLTTWGSHADWGRRKSLNYQKCVGLPQQPNEVSIIIVSDGQLKALQIILSFFFYRVLGFKMEEDGIGGRRKTAKMGTALADLSAGSMYPLEQ